MTARETWIATGRSQVRAWHAVSIPVLLVLPSVIWFRSWPWALPAADQLQLWVWCGSFLAFVTALRYVRHERGLASIALWVLATAVAWGGGYAILAVSPDAGMSRGVAALAIAIGLLSGWGPLVARRRNAIAVTALVTCGLTIGLPRMKAQGDLEMPLATTRATAFHLLKIDLHANVAQPLVDGGAIERLGDGYLVATAQGTFHDVAWDAQGRTRHASRLAIASPLNREAFLADLPSAEDPPFFRLTDILVSDEAGPVLYAAHQYWNTDGKCLTMRVSRAVLDTARGTASPWSAVYETQPCLTMSGAFMHNETGGRLAWKDGRVLLSVGDHGFALDRGLAQDPAGDYGKVLELDGLGGRRIFSLGHRNPQGLLVNGAGQVWSTEHGPQGGDEVNLLSRGGNYGWPLRTHGTQYGLRYWPASDSGRTGLVEPVQSFMPSIGISALIEVGDGPLAQWRGDLLIGSLVGRALFRARVHEDRIVSIERIEIGRRIRDIAQGADGRIALWTDDGHVLVLSESTELPLGEQAYASCAGCHGPDLGGSTLGPSLRSIWGREVASTDRFAYSEAMHRAGGRWTRERLDEFLRDPEAFAPGTTMRVPGVTDPRQRDALLDFILSAW